MIEDAAKAPGTIRKLIVVSKRAAGVPSLPTIADGDVFASPHASTRPPSPNARRHLRDRSPFASSLIHPLSGSAGDERAPCVLG